jgi:hypothetical protein
VNALRTEARAAVTIASARSIICRHSAWAWADIWVASASATNRSPARTAAIASATLGNAGTGFIVTSLRAACRCWTTGYRLLSFRRTWMISETSLAAHADISA